ncbi:MAG: universal stress protein [Desulfatibacillaceae bacterium]
MKPDRILWPTDFSDNAGAALPLVNTMASAYQAEIHVLYVIEDLARHDPYYGEFNQQRMAELRQWEQETAQKRLDEVCSQHLGGCPNFARHIAIGDPATEILKFVRENDIDMVVMATHGRNGQYHYGSVAEKVVKHSPVAVSTVPIKNR